MPLLLWVLLLLGYSCLDDIFMIIVNISLWLRFQMHPILDQGFLVMELERVALSFHIGKDRWAIVLGRIFVWWEKKEVVGVVGFWEVYSSSLSSELLESSSWVELVFLACHDGIGPHSSGCSGSVVSGWWVSRLISWFQYFSFDASCVQCLRVRIDRCALVGYLWIGGIGSRQCSSFQSFVVFQLVVFRCSLVG